MAIARAEHTFVVHENNPVNDPVHARRFVGIHIQRGDSHPQGYSVPDSAVIQIFSTFFNQKINIFTATRSKEMHVLREAISAKLLHRM